MIEYENTQNVHECVQTISHFFPSQDAAHAFLWERAIENGHGIAVGRSRHRFPDSHGQKGIAALHTNARGLGSLARVKRKTRIVLLPKSHEIQPRLLPVAAHGVLYAIIRNNAGE